MNKQQYCTLLLLNLVFIINAIADEKAVDLGAMVISATPLSSDDENNEKAPANIQSVDSKQLKKAQSLSLAEYINRYLGGVTINEAQNNPLQPDIYYRGFVASPLLGLPQGLSTYVNGVRFNEPFGDTVNWDLIPDGAIESLTVYPGSNPVYGLNSLGGALSVKTKTGFTSPEHQFEAYGGSWDRHSEELSSGWNNGTWGYFIDMQHLKDNGWRNFSPSKADQVFGTLSWRGDKGSLDLSLGATDNNLRGNGASPELLQALNRKAVFTNYDQTVNRLFFSELSGNYDLTDDIQLSGNAYFRQNRVHTFNGDGTNYVICGANLCDEDGVVVTDVNGNPVLAGANVNTATNNITQTFMRSRGGTAQALFKQDLFKHNNALTVGASYDNASVNFNSDTELAALTPERGTIGSGILVNDTRVRLHTSSDTVGVYLTDSFSITEALTATVAGRYNHSHVVLQDHYITDPTQTLNGDHTFQRLNPSAGLSYQFSEALTTYGSYSESTRAPTPLELSCADINAPCKLPNSFVSDPDLKQVVAKTWEGGFKGRGERLFKHSGDWLWNLGYFHTINHDDIIFHRTHGVASQGYFSNVGKTRRYGIEAGTTVNVPALFSRIDDWHFGANYTYLNARFLDGFDTPDPLDPNHTATVAVMRGAHIPGIPEHVFKANVSVDLWKKFSIGIDGTYSGQQFLRGDEANHTPPLVGYWLFNAKAEYKVTQHFSVFGKLDNIFDHNYNSFGVYGDATTVPGNFGTGNDRFFSPGSPRAGWVGIRLTM